MRSYNEFTKQDFFNWAFKKEVNTVQFYAEDIRTRYYTFIKIPFCDNVFGIYFSEETSEDKVMTYYRFFGIFNTDTKRLYISSGNTGFLPIMTFLEGAYITYESLQKESCKLFDYEMAKEFSKNINELLQEDVSEELEPFYNAMISSLDVNVQKRYIINQKYINENSNDFSGYCGTLTERDTVYFCSDPDNWLKEKVKQALSKYHKKMVMDAHFFDAYQKREKVLLSNVPESWLIGRKIYHGINQRPDAKRLNVQVQKDGETLDFACRMACFSNLSETLKLDISAMQEDKHIYEMVTAFVQKHGDIEVCDIQEIYFYRKYLYKKSSSLDI